MFISFLSRRLNDISISKKLYFTIGFTALLVTIELCTLWFSVTTLSAVRSYVGGEGLWSKAQKDAVMNLREYAYSHNEKNYAAYQKFLKVPLGDKIARMEMEKRSPDLKIVRQGFLQGRNHPDDIDGLINLSRRFHRINYLHKAFTAWANAEPSLNELIKIGERLHYLVVSGADSKEIVFLLIEIDHINQELTKLEDNFSLTLGEGARWLENLVLKLVLTLSLTIGIISMVFATSINRNLKKGLDAIVDGARLIKAGALNTRVKVYSKDEIGVLAISFNEMTNALDQNIRELKFTEQNLLKESARAEQSEKVKQHFLLNMSHEMRTPMNAILGFARYLEESLSDEDQKMSVRMIIQSGDHLLMILNDILDFSKIETGDINLMQLPFNLTNIVHSIYTKTKIDIGSKEIAVSCSIADNIPQIVYGDSSRLTQIFSNLVSNAIKFTEKGKIDISAAVIKNHDDYIVIEFKIKDTGIGIPVEKQEKIFDVFEQATDGMTRKFGGIGIGLSIVKKLITLQKGKISLSSVPGRGSEFCFQLPFLEKRDTIDYQRNFAGIKILVVDDNVINQLLVIKLLQKQGCETEVAGNGKIALDKYNCTDFDIILMDLQMPEMDGFETTIHIRKMNSYKKDIPIIAMTANTVKGGFEHCMAIGMNDYISKPFYAEELYGKIQRLLVRL